MALTETKPIALGFKAPDFRLLDTKDNQWKTLDSLAGPKGTLVAFICNHCPYVVHVIENFVALSKELNAKGIHTIAISSNDIEKYPQDGPEKMKAFAAEHGFDFPYLFDESQSVAKAYQAECTPDFSLFDEKLKCVYRGRMDASTPGNGKENNGADLREAAQRILEGLTPIEQQHPSMGCNIKWK